MNYYDIKLNPCPFCGDPNPELNISGNSDISYHVNQAYVDCDNCDATGPAFSNPKFDQASSEQTSLDAINAWNNHSKTFEHNTRHHINEIVSHLGDDAPQSESTLRIGDTQYQLSLEYFSDCCYMGSISSMGNNHTFSSFNADSQHEMIEKIHHIYKSLLLQNIMTKYVTEMEGYSYYGSNPGIPVDSLEDVANAIIDTLNL